MDERIKTVADIVCQMLDDNSDRTDLYEQIDDAVDCVFEPGAAIQELPYIKNRHFGMVDIADAVNTGVRTFATLLPQIEISPLNDAQEEYDRTDTLEQAWMWELEKMNRLGTKSIHEQIMEDAMRYHAVALQTEYLPYQFKDKPKDKRIKHILRSRSFNWIRHHPNTVFARHSRFGLEAVAKVCPYTLQTLIDEFGKENTGLAKLLAHLDVDGSDLLNTWYVLVDYTDWERRTIFISATPSDKIPDAVEASDYILMDEEHGLPFIPWVIVDKGDPIWKSVLTSGIWDNAQYMEMLRFAKAIEVNARSTMVVKTPDGTLSRIWIDYSNPSAPIVVPLDGSAVDYLPKDPLDPQMEVIFQEIKGTISSSTVSTVLRDMSRFANTPFSSVNQMVNIALSQLSRAKNAAGDAEALAILQGFEWISHSGIPYHSYRPKTTDSKVDTLDYKGRGGQIVISPKAAPTMEELQEMSPQELALQEKTVYYDLDALYIRVNLQSSNTTDEQSRENVVINAVDKLGMSKREAWEKMGWGEKYKINSVQRLEELFDDQTIKNELLKMDLATQEQMKAELTKQMQAEQEAAAAEQAKSQQASQNEMGGGQQPTTQGMDMRAGGNPQAMANPQGTREMVSGEDQSGQDVQR
jgi:hypothetical protein